VTARSFARRFSNAYRDGKGVDIYAFRIGNVVEPHEYAKNFKKFLMEIDCRKRNAWSYIDARDLGKMCHLASKTSGLGFQVSSTRCSYIPSVSHFGWERGNTEEV